MYVCMYGFNVKIISFKAFNMEMSYDFNLYDTWFPCSESDCMYFFLYYMYIYIYVCTYICVYVFIYVCTYVCFFFITLRAKGEESSKHIGSPPYQCSWFAAKLTLVLPNAYVLNPTQRIRQITFFFWKYIKILFLFGSTILPVNNGK